MHSPKDPLLQFLFERESIVVVAGSTTPNDTLPASLSIALVATSLKKNVSLVAQQDIPHHLTFLRFDTIIPSPSFSPKTSLTISSRSHRITNAYYTEHSSAFHILLTDAKNETIPYADITVSEPQNKRGVIAVGCTPQESEKIRTEHHLAQQELYVLQRTKPSTSHCELITWMLKKNQDLMTQDIATALMTGIIITSDNFQNPNTTPQSLFAAAYLTSCGAEKETIVRSLYTTRSSAFITAWGTLLSRFHYNTNRRTGYTYLLRDEMEKGRLTHNEIPSLLNELRTRTPCARFVILGVQTEKTLVCMGSVIEGSPSPLVRNLGATMHGSSFSIPVRVRTSIQHEMSALEKTISSLII